MRTVIIDDSFEDRGLVVDMLKSAGETEIQEFSEAKSALAYLSDHRADLVLLDYRLEDDIGIAHIARIKALQPGAANLS